MSGQGLPARWENWITGAESRGRFWRRCFYVLSRLDPSRGLRISPMKAIVIEQLGKLENLAVKDAPDPTPQSNQVIVRVEAAGVNFADISSSMGKYPGVKVPYVAGREFAGVVEATGERVMGYTQMGAFAEKIAVSRSFLWPQPEGWTSVQAAAFPVNFFTAYL